MDLDDLLELAPSATIRDRWTQLYGELLAADVPPEFIGPASGQWDTGLTVAGVSLILMSDGTVLMAGHPNDYQFTSVGDALRYAPRGGRVRSIRRLIANYQRQAAEDAALRVAAERRRVRQESGKAAAAYGPDVLDRLGYPAAVITEALEGVMGQALVVDLNGQRTAGHIVVARAWMFGPSPVRLVSASPWTVVYDRRVTPRLDVQVWQDQSYSDAITFAHSGAVLAAHRFAGSLGDRPLSASDVADQIPMSSAALSQALTRAGGDGPIVVDRDSRGPLYHPDLVRAWLNARPGRGRTAG